MSQVLSKVYHLVINYEGKQVRLEMLAGLGKCLLSLH